MSDAKVVLGWIFVDRNDAPPAGWYAVRYQIADDTRDMLATARYWTGARWHGHRPVFRSLAPKWARDATDRRHASTTP